MKKDKEYVKIEIVRAVQWPEDFTKPLPNWMNDVKFQDIDIFGNPKLYVRTPRGNDMILSHGDYLVVDKNGTMSVCERDFFEKCYSTPVEESRVLRLLKALTVIEEIRDELHYNKDLDGLEEFLSKHGWPSCWTLGTLKRLKAEMDEALEIKKELT